MSQELNKLIASFMGYQILHKKFQYKDYNSSNEFYYNTDEGDIVCDSNGREVNLYSDGDPLFDLSELPFDSDWNWLMPVVEKIESLDLKDSMYSWEGSTEREYNFESVEVEINKDSCWISINLSLDPSIYIADVTWTGNKIRAVYDAVVLFIKYYNERFLK